MSALVSTIAKMVLTVCSSNCDYSSIQDAVLHVTEGATIKIHGGVYREKNIKINKNNIKLIGEQWPEIDAENEAADIFSIQGSNIEISGLILKNVGQSYTREFAAIKAEIGTINCKIYNNQFNKNTYSIYLAKTKNCTIKQNKIVGTNRSEADGGNGIHVWVGEHLMIEDNDIQQNRDGIYFEFVNNSKILNNNSYKNVRYGLHYMTTQNNIYENNIFSQNEAGVAVMYSRQITMRKNIFENNRGISVYGMLLKEVVNSTVSENIFRNNTVGMFLEGVSRSKFFDNEIIDNGHAIKIFGSCDSNVFKYNNFISNSFEVVTNTTFNFNEFGENYWGQYIGYDLDKDGIGDVPYMPVSYSSVITESFDSTFVLLRSGLFSLLDWIEQTFPELIPALLKDEKPLMAPKKRVAL